MRSFKLIERLKDLMLQTNTGKHMILIQ